MMYVEWYNEELDKMCLSKMIFWKAIIVHCSGFGKIVPKKNIVFN